MRLRRKKDEALEPRVEPAETSTDHEETGADVSTSPASPTGGPIDISELDPETVYIDLGSLLIPPAPELELRLQVEEGTNEVVAVLLVADEGVLEARAFASSRGGDLWDEARKEIAAETVERGGTAVEQEGPFGTELYCEVPVVGAEGEQLFQPSRVIGYSGERWFLRATVAGRPAMDPEYAVAFDDAIRSIAVRRGTEAMAPGTALPLQLPPEARQLDDA